MEQIARELVEQEDRDREVAEREAREREEREASERRARGDSELTSPLEEHVVEEIKSISKLEDHIRKRKRSLHASIEKMPSQSRARIGTERNNSDNMSPAIAVCVVCHTAPSSRAIIPCGHHCLCNDCAVTLTAISPLCPLCRSVILSTLKIYAST